MKNTVQGHVKMLNFTYKNGLRGAGVTYINGLAKFEDTHTLSYLQRFKEKEGDKTLTADKIIVAVGGRPHVPTDVPGAYEHAITSDDIFSLKTSPGKTLCIGAGYISLECAGFLHECGFDTTVAVRSILLRGFDRDCAEKIGAVMEAQGVNFLRSVQPKSIVKGDDGRLTVEFSHSDNTTSTDVFDTVLYVEAHAYGDTV